MQKTAPSEQCVEGLDFDQLPVGRRIKGRLAVHWTASGQSVTVPFLALRGSTEGPLLWINGAVHGDEINGALAAVGFFNSLTGEVAGSVVATPVSNVLALDERRKSSTIDGLDMDQSFPGRHDGLATERIAATLFEKIGRKADIAVNLHTLGTAFHARPYAVYKTHPNARLSESALLQHIACFTPEFACRMPVASAQGELPGNVSGALDYQCLLAGKTAFMIELGAGGRYDEGAVRTGIDGLFRLSRRLAMTAIGTDRAPSRRLRRVTSRRHIMADAAGFFLGQAQPGRVLAKGNLLGVIQDVFGEVVNEVRFDEDVLVIAIRRDPVVHTGDRLAFIGTVWDDVDVED